MSTVTAEMRTGQQLGIALVVVLNALPVWGVLAGEWSIGALNFGPDGKKILKAYRKLPKGQAYHELVAK